MKLYIVSTFGDITLEQKDSDVLVTTKDMTLPEQKIVKNLMKRFGIKNFADTELDNRTIKFKDSKLSEIQKLLTKGLKGDKPVLTAIKIKEGAVELIEEITEEDTKKDADIVVTQKPSRGCPMPEVTKRKEKEASRILKIFLEQQQLTDYEHNGSFISIGNWSRRPYMITSRWSPLVSTYGQVYDIVNKKVICASCDDIPPSESMLSLMLSIEHREYEFINAV